MTLCHCSTSSCYYHCDTAVTVPPHLPSLLHWATVPPHLRSVTRCRCPTTLNYHCYSVIVPPHCALSTFPPHFTITVTLCRCPTTLYYHCYTVPLTYYTWLSLLHCVTVPPHLNHCYTVPLSYHTLLSLLHCATTFYYHCHRTPISRL